MAGTCQEYSFFIFASCEPLTHELEISKNKFNLTFQYFTFATMCACDHKSDERTCSMNLRQFPKYAY